MKSVLFTIFLAGLAAFIVSCKGNDGAQGPAGPTLTGSLSGYVYLVDQNDNLLTNRSGVTVSIGGTNLSTTSDSTGKWTLNNVSTGVYQITFSKSGYDSFILPTNQFVGGGSVNIADIYLVQRQTFGVTTSTIKDSSISVYNGTVLWMTDSLSSPVYTTGKRVFIFVGTSPSVSSDPATYQYAVAVNPNAVAKAITRLFSSQELVSAGFPSGSTVYFVSYGTSEYYSSYRDTATGHTFYTGLSYTPSNVVSAVVP